MKWLRDKRRSILIGFAMLAFGTPLLVVALDPDTDWSIDRGSIHERR